ncbi:MAG TPA: lamin tail domain-containing protein, partial [Acidimicrobiia bacterium]|nr:lamin tail domain-containing protein [Acidimicrobiia bacterium]
DRADGQVTTGGEVAAAPADEPTTTTAVTSGSSPEHTGTTPPSTTAASPDTTGSGPTSLAGPHGSSTTTGPARARPAPTTTTTKPPASGDPTAVLVGLRVAPEGARAGYDRELFPHWVDEDGNRCDTREEVLIAESHRAAQVDPYGCKVLAGDWVSLYDGLSVTDPGELDIDHVVALAEAWDSGASGWDTARRRAFANDLGLPQALRAVSASSNRSKSDLDPGQWKPTRESAWCEYAHDWVTVKKAWDLSADQNEIDDLRVMLRTCSAPLPESRTTPPPTAAPTTTTTAAPPVAGGAVTVTALDCQAETVVVRNGGPAPADLTGWSLHDAGAIHTYRFPAGYTLGAGASVTIRSGGPAGPGEIGWTGQNVWNNTGDTASLLNAAGTVVSTRPCS